MSLTTEEIRRLTESKFWKPEIGTEYNVEFGNPRYDERAYKDESEKRPTLVLDVLRINGEPMVPPKEFNSCNKALNRVLIAAELRAVRDGRTTFRVAMQRLDKKTYHVIDFAIVDDVLKNRQG